MLRLALHWQILIATIAGAVVGVALNRWAGEYAVQFEPPGTHLRLAIHDSTNRIEIDVLDRRTGETRHLVVDPTSPEAFPTLGDLAATEPEIYKWFRRRGRSLARRVGDASHALGGLFLRMLKMVSVPLIIASLMSGITGLGHARRLGSLFGRTAVYYASTSLLAIVTGLMLVNLIRPGLGKALAAVADGKLPESAGLGEVLFQQLEAMIPSNPLAAVAQGQFLSIISFTLLFGIFTLLVGGRTAEIIRDVFQAIFEVMMRMTMAIIRVAPFGVLMLMLSATATLGLRVFGPLSWYFLTVLCALAIHAVFTLPLILRFVAHRSPWQFAHAMSPALLTAFSSASSNATLPLTLSCAEKRAGISNRVSSFVLPLGATINMDGTALYEAVAVLFIAQVHFGASLPFSQQIIVAITALLASVGAAGIPHAGLVMMAIILQAVGLPLEMQGIILAVDRVLDMCRTSVNVWSDSCGCAVVARLETSRAAHAPLPTRATTDDAFP